jgi:Ala-tRNA(Pro) deacylase
MAVIDRIQALLQEHRAPHTLIEHTRADSALTAAAARGASLHIGGKSLVMKVGRDDFRLFVISGACRTDGRALRRFLGASRMRFATKDELLALTGLEPGCVPPFGRPVLDLPLYVDQSIADNDQIAFSPGVHTASMIMSTRDYLRAAQPVAIFPFALATPLGS